MDIVLLEDDPLQEDFIKSKLEEAGAFPQAKVIVIRTESEFRNRLEEIVQLQPSVVVLDVMVRWADPAPDMELPTEDVRREKYYTAGIRCAGLLANACSETPIILYTILEESDLRERLDRLPKSVVHLGKGLEITPLIEKIREVARGR